MSAEAQVAEATNARGMSDPVAAEAEIDVLAVCLLAPAALTTVLESGVGVEHFARQSNRLVFAAMTKLRDDDRHVTPVSVNDVLDGEALLDEAGGRGYVHLLASTAALVAWTGEYVDILLRRHRERILKMVGEQLANGAGEEALAQLGGDGRGA